MRDFGPHRVGMPHTRPFGHKLWEMRFGGRAGIGRAIFVLAPPQRIVVLRVFQKKTEKTPRSEIEAALKRMKDWLK